MRVDVPRPGRYGLMFAVVSIAGVCVVIGDYGMCCCGASGVRLLAAIAFCDACFEAVLAPIRERVIERQGLEGVGVRDGVDRPEHGPGACDLRCVSCGATWVGRVGTECVYCEIAVEKMIGWQRELLLRCELPDPDDKRYNTACEAWAERLAVGVRAGIVTEAQARSAWSRKVVSRYVA